MLAVTQRGDPRGQETIRHCLSTRTQIYYHSPSVSQSPVLTPRIKMSASNRQENSKSTLEFGIKINSWLRIAQSTTTSPIKSLGPLQIMAIETVDYVEQA